MTVKSDGNLRPFVTGLFGALFAGTVVFLCTRNIQQAFWRGMEAFVPLAIAAKGAQHKDSMPQIVQPLAECVDTGLSMTVDPLIDAASETQKFASSFFTSSESSAPTPTPRKQTLTSATETLHLFNGTEELKLEEAEVSSLREQFIEIEKEIRETQSFLLEDEKELGNQEQALAKVLSEIQDVNSGSSSKVLADLQNELKFIEDKIKDLEQRLKITLSIDFETCTICYTNGKGHKIKADFHKNPIVETAVKTLVEIHNKALTRHLEEKAKQDLQKSEEIKGKGKFVKVLDVKLGDNKCLLDIDGKEEWITIPQDNVPSAYLELGNRKQFYIAMAAKVQKVRPIELSIERLKSSKVAQTAENISKQKESRWTYYLNPSQSTWAANEKLTEAEEKVSGPLLVEIDREINGLQNSNTGGSSISSAGLIHYIPFLEALIDVPLTSPLSMDDLTRELNKIGNEELKGKGFKCGVLTAETIREASLKKLQEVDFEYVSKNLTGSAESKEIKNKILKILQERVEFQDPNPNKGFDQETVSNAIRGITSLEGIQDVALEKAKEDLLEEIKKIDLKYLLNKWKARKINLNTLGVQLKAKEAEEFNKRRLNSMELLCSKQEEEKIAQSSKYDAEEHRKILNSKATSETDLDLRMARNVPLFKSFLKMKEMPAIKNSRNPFKDIFNAVKGSEYLSKEDIQHLVDWSATLVNPRVSADDPFSYESFSIFVASLNTAFDAYMIPPKQFGLAAAFESNNTAAGS